jgi:hypothetical protein
MLQTRWSAEAWAQVRVEFKKALALRSEIRRAAVQLAITEHCSCGAVLARVGAFGETAPQPVPTEVLSLPGAVRGNFQSSRYVMPRTGLLCFLRARAVLPARARARWYKLPTPRKGKRHV